MYELFYFDSPKGENSHLEKTGQFITNLGTKLGELSKKIQEEDPNQKEVLKREFQNTQDHLNTMFKLSKSKNSPGIK